MTKTDTAKPEQGKLLPAPKGQYKQQKLDGSGVLKQTAPKEVREAVEHYFAKKEDLDCATSNADKAKEKILTEMHKAKCTLVIVKDNAGTPRRIHICADERLKIEKDTDA